MRNLTIVATIILPLNLVTGSWFIVHSISPCRMFHRLMFSRGFEGLWGMNMPVPFQTGTSRDIGKCPIITEGGGGSESISTAWAHGCDAGYGPFIFLCCLFVISKSLCSLDATRLCVRSPGYHSF